MRWLPDEDGNYTWGQALPVAFDQYYDYSDLQVHGVDDAGRVVGSLQVELPPVANGEQWREVGIGLYWDAPTPEGRDDNQTLEGPRTFGLADVVNFIPAGLYGDGKVAGMYDYYLDGEISREAESTFGFFEAHCFDDGTARIDSWTVDYDSGTTREVTFQVEVQDLCQTSVANTASVSTRTPEITSENNSGTATIGVNAVSLKAGVSASRVVASLNNDIVYTFSVTNDGPGRADDVRLFGTWPRYANNLYDTVNTESNEWYVGTLEPGETWTTPVSTTVQTNEPNLVLVATAAVDTTTIQCDRTGTRASAQTITGSWPNVAVAITGPPTVEVSTATESTGTWLINWKSNGNDVARAVTVSHTLPAGTRCVSANPAPTNGGCTPGGTELVWALGPALPPGSEGVIAVTLALPGCARVATSVDNGVVIATTSIESDTSDNQALTTTYLTEPVGRLEASAFFDRARPFDGERVNVIVNYANVGAADVSGSSLVVPLPAHATLVAGSAVGATVGTSDLTWSLGTLAAGESGAVGFSLLASGSLGDLIAAVGPGGPPPVTLPMRMTGTGACEATRVLATAVIGAPDTLDILKTASASALCGAANKTLGWRIAVVNHSATAMAGVVVRDVLPAGLAYQGGTISGPGANANGAPTLEWQVGTLAAGQGVILGYATNAPPSTQTLKTNTATVTATGVAAIESAPATVVLDCGPAVELTTSLSGSCGLAGRELDVALRWVNRGALPLTGAAISARLPAGLEFVASSDGASHLDGVVSATRNVPALGTGSVGFRVRVASGVPNGTLLAFGATLAAGDVFATSNEVSQVALTCAAAPSCRRVDCGAEGVCIYPADTTQNGATCADGSACTQEDTCFNGSCVGTTITCNDNQQCTRDGCNPATGCTFVSAPLDGQPCIDGNACTEAEVCAGGACGQGLARDCDDDNPCTDDSCDPASGCSYVGNTLACNDKNACTTNDTCNAETGACVGGAPPICDDGNQCTADTCNQATGCVITPLPGQPCSDGTTCTAEDTCVAAGNTLTCVGTALACDDQNPCTIDSCVNGQGCKHVAGNDGASCDDHDLCSNNDACLAGECVGAEPTCFGGDDGGACAGGCNPATGECDFSGSNGNECEDSIACTVDDVCNEGVCFGSLTPELGEPEICNGFDDDCDGAIDDGFGVGDTCVVGLGLCEREGAWACDAEGGVFCNGTPGPAAAEQCDGSDNDCDGLTDAEDDSLQLVACLYQLGVCEGSMKSRTMCVTPEAGPAFWEACSDEDYAGQAYPAVYVSRDDDGDLCDGDNNDCDEQTDEDFDGDTVACGTGVCAVEGDEVCVGGVVQVQIGEELFARCVAPAATTAELCGNGEDDDCDGTIDLDFAGYALLGVACDGSDDDLCKGGVIRCNDDENGTECSDDAASIAEICDGGDNDCDGQIDEGFTYAYGQTQVALKASCDGDDVDRCADGQVVCAGGVAVCDDDGTSKQEMCNGIDDDCDGAVDELWTAVAGVAPFLGDSCDGSNDSDLCKNGRVECDFDFAGSYCHETSPGIVETCNHADDDCDGATDEDFGVGLACTVGIGRCANTGVVQCVSGGAVGCSVAPLGAAPEICNALDDDCDGRLDNGGVCGAIDTDIRSGPPPLTSATTAEFTYVNPLSIPLRAHTTFECSLDGATYTACNHGGTTADKTYANLAPGAHTLLVRATNPDGSYDSTPDYWTWIIDTSTPDTVILSAPTSPSQSRSGTIVFGSPTPNPDFYSCVLDPLGGICPANGAAAYAVCPEAFPFTNLADGSHTICVYVTDTRGVPDPVPASYTWLIDTSAPETEIVAAIPPPITSSTSVTFHYVDPTAPTTNTFECSLDGSDWEACNGKTDSYTGLAEGEHRFDVRTVDPNGVVDPTPASYAWTIDVTAPCATVALHPSDPSQSPNAAFAFTASEPLVSFRCALDPAPADLDASGAPRLSAYVPCGASVQFDDLTDGTHSLWVYALDEVGNLGTCRAQYTWLIDTRYPETEITAGPPPLTGAGEVATLDYIDPLDEDAVTFECKLDGAADWTRCDGLTAGEGGTSDYEDLAVGRHTFAVRTCDFSKAPPVQCDPTPATHVWEVTVSPCPNDRTAPDLTCADDLVLECAAGGATVDLGALAPSSSDSCQPVAVSSSAGAAVGLGQTPLVFVATDPNGNMASCVTLVTVLDTTAPVITCPADVLDATTDDGGCWATMETAAATGDDLCQGSGGLLVFANEPKHFAPGETTVTHRVVDAAGNESLCEQKVVVRDDEPLVLTCSESEVVDAAPDACEWTGTRVAVATDNCSDQLSVDVTGTYPVGESPIVFAAQDAAGNSDECITLLTVRDVTSPVVACGRALGTVPMSIRASADDACSAVVRLDGVTCTRVVDGVRTPLPLPQCPLTVNDDTIEIGGRLTDGVLEVTYQATAVDPSGNAASVDCVHSWEPDQDGDGIIDAEDNCVITANGDQGDGDEDGVGDLCDLCPDVSDPTQADSDDDGVGDACSDKDRDSILDAADNCELEPNTDQLDNDGDELGDVCDPSPYEGLTAEGDGGCAGAGGGLVGALAGGALVLAMLARRRRARGN